MKPLILALAYVGATYAQCTLTNTYDLGPGTDGNQATGTGPFHLTATNSTFSYVGFIPGGSVTFAQLTSLSATFTSNSGGSGGGTPRLSISLNDHGTPKSLYIYLGNPPNYVDNDAALNTYSNRNLIGNNDAGRYDDSHFAGGSPYTTYSNALALLGSLPVLEIYYVTDTFGNFPSRDETLQAINMTGPCPADALQVAYAANLGSGDSFVNITNSGTKGNICVNVYVFDPSEEMVACCACPVTPNALVSLSVQDDLIDNAFTPVKPLSVVIDLLASAGITCDPGLVGPNLVSGLKAWGTTLHAVGTKFAVTENDFLTAPVNSAQLLHFSAFCGFIENNGSGYGICKPCRTGGLGGAKR